MWEILWGKNRFFPLHAWACLYTCTGAWVGMVMHAGGNMTLVFEDHISFMEGCALIQGAICLVKLDVTGLTIFDIMDIS